MVEIVVSVAAKVAEYMVDPVCRQLSYLFKHHHHVEDVIQQTEELERVRETVGNLVQVARTQGDEIIPDVEKWLENAQGIIQKREGFAEDEKQASKSCFYLKSRYRLSKKAKMQALDIYAKLQQASKFGNIVSRCPPPPPLITAASSRNCEAFPSRHSIFDRIMEALRNEETNMVGVWGMGGVGKTTLALQVAKQAEEEKLFHKVVMASSISQTPNISEIQREIAKTLGLTFPEGENRAVRLKNSLKNQETILVILDDIWDELDLGKIGIPYGDDHKGCKLLLTSRDRRVLDSDMEAQQVFHLPNLNAEEAWNLFKRTAGDSVESPQIRPIADEIVKHCEGLPVAIVTIAKALKKNSVPEWKNALDELKKAAPKNLRGVSEKVYSCLELSYKHLEGGEAKSLFLLCGLLEDANISMDRLLLYCMGLNLFKGLHSWEKTTNKVIALVEGLKASSLLLDPDQDRAKGRYGSMFFDYAFVKMHDVVRDVARSIAFKDACQYVVREAAELTATLSYSRISLECGDMVELPQRLMCPELELFLLNSRFNGGEDIRIPDDFFQGLTKLRIVHLSGVSLGPSLASLGFLSNLRTLCLNECELQDMAIVGGLKSLQALSLAGSYIEELPKEVKQLRDLRLLDLRHCRVLRIIPRDVISSLSRLEYLSLKGCYSIEWERDEVNRRGEINKACLWEIKHLPQLKTLEVEVLDASMLPDDEMLFHNDVNLSRYSILIGEQLPSDEYSRSLEAANVKSLEVLLNCFSQPFKSVQGLRARNLNGIKDVVYELDRDHHGFVELKNLVIQKCPNIEYILDSRRDHQWVPPCNTLCMLEQLCLVNLDNLEAVCQGPIPVGCFRNLRLLQLWSCKRLKHVFASSEYPTMELAFPQLQHLNMEYLPELIRFFYSTTTTTTEGSQDRIPIFNRQVSFPALESIFVRELINTQALWEKRLAVAVDSFPKVLRRISIFGCHKLQNVFSLCVAKALVQLEHLAIYDCDGMETIVVDEEEDEQAVLPPTILFPRVTNLQLCALPQLKRFCSCTRITLRWPALESLEVGECNEVEVLFQGLIGPNEGDQQLIDITTIRRPLFLVDQDAFLALESISISSSNSMRALWYSRQISADFFPRLKRLEVNSCGKLMNIFPLSMAKALGQLQQLQIESCEGVEEIVTSHEDETAASLSLFPNLTSLTLKNLPRLKKFCSKWFASRLPRLKSLTLWECHKVEILFVQEIGVEGGGLAASEIQQPFFFLQKEAFSNLEKLSIANLGAAVGIWQGQFLSVSFSKLTWLTIEQCHCISVVIPRNVVQALHNLKILKVKGCGLLNEVIQVVTGESPTYDEIDFPKLERLELEDLRNLNSFCSAICIFRFPSLKHVAAKKCPKMELFCKGDLQAPMLKYEGMGILLRQYWETNLNTTVQLIRQAHLQGTIKEPESDFSDSTFSEEEMDDDED